MLLGLHWTLIQLEHCGTAAEDTRLELKRVGAAEAQTLTHHLRILDSSGGTTGRGAPFARGTAAPIQKRRQKWFREEKDGVVKQVNTKCCSLWPRWLIFRALAPQDCL